MSIDLSAFKTLLEEQIAQTAQELEKIKADIYPKENKPTDKVAHLGFKLDQQVTFQRHQEYTKRLNLLKRAYGKFETNSYGICEECEEPIGEGRLKIVPESRYCMECICELGL